MKIKSVIPAKAGIQIEHRAYVFLHWKYWIPACAGMTFSLNLLILNNN